MIADQIIATQEWEESSESKTGWVGSGWLFEGDPISDMYQLLHVIEYDKFYYPVKAVFTKSLIHLT